MTKHLPLVLAAVSFLFSQISWAETTIPIPQQMPAKPGAPKAPPALLPAPAPVIVAPTLYSAEFFSYDGVVLRTARRAHTFARFTRVEPDGTIEVVEISFLPAAKDFRIGHRLPNARVEGRNYTIEDTFALAEHRKVTNHGKFPITAELFLAARTQRLNLESGRIDFKMDDCPGDGTLNSLHALTGILGFVKNGPKQGKPATDSVIELFAKAGQLVVPGPGLPLNR